jgi:hypothetical protein
VALSYSIKKRRVMGNVARNLVELTIGVAGDYSAGGITLSPGSCGLGTLESVHVVGCDKAVLFGQDPVSNKLKGYKGNGAAVLTEVAGADVAGGIVRFIAEGDSVTGY